MTIWNNCFNNYYKPKQSAIDLQERNLNHADIVELRTRFTTFAEEWDSPEMTVYDDYDASRKKMAVHELTVEMNLLEQRLLFYEKKYGILSVDFYATLMAGKFEQFDEDDEIRRDFSCWKGIYETWQRRQAHYRTASLYRI